MSCNVARMRLTERVVAGEKRAPVVVAPEKLKTQIISPVSGWWVHGERVPPWITALAVAPRNRLRRLAAATAIVFRLPRAAGGASVSGVG
jgi:hypothetical protein